MDEKKVLDFICSVIVCASFESAEYRSEVLHAEGVSI